MFLYLLINLNVQYDEVSYAKKKIVEEQIQPILTVSCSF